MTTSVLQQPFDKFTHEEFVKCLPLLNAWICRQAQKMLGHFHDAEDITQDVLTRLYEDLPALRANYDDRKSVSLITYLCQAARNKLISACRRHVSQRTRHAPHPDLDSSRQGQASIDPRRHYLRGRLRDAINSALGTLSPKDRALFLAVYRDHYPQNKVALELGVKPSTLNRRIHRIRERVVKYLRRRHTEVIHEIFDFTR